MECKNIAVIISAVKIGWDRIRMGINVDEVGCVELIVSRVKSFYLEPKVGCKKFVFVFPVDFCPGCFLLKEEIFRDFGRQIKLGSDFLCCHFIQFTERALYFANSLILKLYFNCLSIIVSIVSNGTKAEWVSSSQCCEHLNLSFKYYTL